MSAEQNSRLRPFLAQLTVVEIVKPEPTCSYDAALEMTPGADNDALLTQSLITRADGDPTRDEPTDR